MTRNVRRIDNGKATTGMRVSRARPRKIKMTSTTRTNAFAIDGAAFRGQKLDENQEKAWIQQAQDLIAQAQALPH